MPQQLRYLLGISTLVATACVGLGCGAADEIEELENCASVCDTYSDCVEDIDVSECTDQCREMSESDASMSALDTCDDCIEDKSCAQATACIPSCPFIPTPEE